MRTILRRLLRVSEPVRAATKPGRRRLGPYDLRMPIYAVGDVHGCYRELLAAEAKVQADCRAAGKAIVVYLGDYIDRGPNSSLVLDHLSRDDHHDGLVRIPLCGNHDDAFLNFIRDPASSMAWLEFGGDATLHSYGIDAAYTLRHGGPKSLATIMSDTIPRRHIAFLEDLPICLQTANYVFVHAGLKPGLPLDEQNDEDLMWIREPFLTSGPALSVTVIHGHTPVVDPQFGKNRIGIDTACFATGRLTVLKVSAEGTRLL